MLKSVKIKTNMKTADEMLDIIFIDCNIVINIKLNNLKNLDF